jgi:hypothetical protein
MPCRGRTASAGRRRTRTRSRRFPARCSLLAALIIGPFWRLFTQHDVVTSHIAFMVRWAGSAHSMQTSGLPTVKHPSSCLGMHSSQTHANTMQLQEVERLGKAMKDPKFRDEFAAYARSLEDPEVGGARLHAIRVQVCCMAEGGALSPASAPSNLWAKARQLIT